MIVAVTVTVAIRAEPERVFAAMVDLESQDRWILGTRLYALDGEAQVPAEGSRMAALTGILGIGVLDVMEVTRYEPPTRWETRHVGSAFQGRGVFAVERAGDGAAATWIEEIDLPAIIARIGWPLARPVVGWGLRRSLRRLARGVEAGTLPPVAQSSGRPGRADDEG